MFLGNSSYPSHNKRVNARSSFARKTSISFAFNMMALQILLSPVLSTAASIRPPFVDHQPLDAHMANTATYAPPTDLAICDGEVETPKSETVDSKAHSRFVLRILILASHF